MSDIQNEDVMITAPPTADSEVIDSVLEYKEEATILPNDGIYDRPNNTEPPVTSIPLDTLSNLSSSTAVVAPAPMQARKLSLDMMQDIPITLVFEVGRTSITIKDLMELCTGSFIELRHTSIDSIDVRINDRIVSQAETVGLQQRYGIRFGEVMILSSFEVENRRA